MQGTAGTLEFGLRSPGSQTLQGWGGESGHETIPWTFLGDLRHSST